VKIGQLLENHTIIDGDFNNLAVFNFKGVYILYESKTQEVVYVGSAYARNINERLKQYLRVNDSGNSLMHAICKEDFNVNKVKEIDNEQKRKAVDKIKTLKIKAIHHKDLEYQLISESQPKYNKAGVEVDYTI
jgi:excinuclease UvrABC nuclease subunit